MLSGRGRSERSVTRQELAVDSQGYLAQGPGAVVVSVGSTVAAHVYLRSCIHSLRHQLSLPEF